MRTPRTTIVGLTLLILVGAWVGVAEAHDHGVLTLASRTLRAGDSLVIVGAKFSHNDAVALALVGAGGRVPLGNIPTDAAGAFRRTLWLPATTTAGQYRLVAKAPDGDEAASLDVVVVAPGGSGAAMPAEVPGMEHPAAHDSMSMGPTGAPLAIARAHSTAVTVTAMVLIVVCALAGVQLVRGARVTPPTEDIS